MALLLGLLSGWLQAPWELTLALVVVGVVFLVASASVALRHRTGRP